MYYNNVVLDLKNLTIYADTIRLTNAIASVAPRRYLCLHVAAGFVSSENLVSFAGSEVAARQNKIPWSFRLGSESNNLLRKKKLLRISNKRPRKSDGNQLEMDGYPIRN